MKNGWNGWIKLFRKLMNWEWYQDSYMVHLFIHLLLSANREPGKWKGIEIARGQLITGRKKLSEETGISERKIRTCINRLKSTSELTIKTTNRFSLITICNYESYQVDISESDQQNDQPTANKRPATDHKQEDKKRKKKENYKVLFDKVKQNLGYDLPEGFDELILTWLKYKSEKNQSFKETGLMAMINKLVTETGGNLNDARAWIQNSMANNYQGIYPPKNTASQSTGFNPNFA